jgi:uncharacterized Ntn-hydrolase superfamily protein
MKRSKVHVAVITLGTVALLGSGTAARGAEPVATFSIVGADPETGEIGVAVQSKFFAVGAVVPFARAGIGAVATQAFANTTYGPRGLRLLEEGLDPARVIEVLTETDSGSASRQVGVIDETGAVATFTGTECAAWAGGVTGRNFAAQGNILTGADVVEAMARAFEQTGGRLGERLMRALEAGQAAGGDSRGMQSAAILVVKEGAGYGGFNDRFCDLRVDDALDPISELRRVFDLWKWNALINEGYVHAEAGRWDEAFAAGDELIRMASANGESYYHPACYYAKAGQRARALELLEAATKRDPSLGPRARTDTDFNSIKSDEVFMRITSAP